MGTNVVASMVVFEDGLARKSEYGRFAIVKGHEGTDDISAIHEVITRRFRRYLAEREKTGELDTLGDPGAVDDQDQDLDPERAVAGAQKKFAYPPNLVVVDGGPLQAAAAARALVELGIDDIAVCGLAKRLEEGVAAEAEDYPVILPRSSEGLVPASAGPGRGSSIRDHLSPAEAGQGRHRERARRRARPRRGPPQDPACSSPSARCVSSVPPASRRSRRYRASGPQSSPRRSPQP